MVSKRDPSKWLRGLTRLLVVVLLALAVWTAYVFYDPKTTSLPPEAGPPELASIPKDIVSLDRKTRRDAETRVLDLLLDPSRADFGFRVSRVEVVSGVEWIDGWGGQRLVSALLSRFEGDAIDEARAHTLLQGLVRRYPQIVEFTEVPFLLDASDAEASTYDLSCALAFGGIRCAGYLLYQIELSTDAPGELRTVTLLRYLAGLPRDDARTARTLRLLARVPDRRLAWAIGRVASQVDTVSEGWQALLDERVGTDSGFVDLLAWSRSDDLEARRRARLELALAHTDRATKLRAIHRYRYDPIPALDLAILDLARRAEPLDLRLAALEALASLPTRASATTIIAALDDATTRGVAARALFALTGLFVGSEPGEWDLGAPLLLENQRLRELTDRANDVANGLREVDLVGKLRSESPPREVFSILPLLAGRGELQADFGNLVESWVVALLADDPWIRERAWAGFHVWPAPPIPVLLDAARRERDPDIRRTIIDHLLVATEDDEVPLRFDALIDAVAEGEFRGIAIARAFALVWRAPSIELTLGKAARSPDPRRRAAALYLLSGLTSQVMHLGRTSLLAMIEQLGDGEELVRFWAHTALTAVTGQDFGYDPQLSPVANQRAMVDWRTWLDESMPQ